MARTQLCCLAMFAGLMTASNPVRAIDPCYPETPAAHVNLRIGNFQGNCNLELGGPIPIVDVWVDVYALPFTEVRLSLPDPPLGTVLSEEWFFPATGNRTTGIEFDLGGCTPPVPPNGVTLGRLVVLVPPGTMGCGMWKADDGAEIVDCEGVVRDAVEWPFFAHTAGQGFCAICCNSCCWPPGSYPAYDLFPSDGATAVPVATTLSWDGTFIPTLATRNIQATVACYVVIGTDPDCATWTAFEVDCDLQTFAPGFLQPATTYYWRVMKSDPFCTTVTPTRSFTTETGLPASPATWGRVKSMYRD